MIPIHALKLQAKIKMSSCRDLLVRAAGLQIKGSALESQPNSSRLFVGKTLYSYSDSLHRVHKLVVANLMLGVMLG